MIAKDLTIVLENKPGTLEQLSETLAKAGINILGGCGLVVGEKGEIHIAVQDAAKARSALEARGIHVSHEREMLLIYMRAVPGELDRQTRTLADAGVNIDLFYWTEDGRLAIGADDLSKAKDALYPPST